eukprot:745901-Hanusia_phi.AAC.1
MKVVPAGKPSNELRSGQGRAAGGGGGEHGRGRGEGEGRKSGSGREVVREEETRDLSVLLLFAADSTLRVGVVQEERRSLVRSWSLRPL